MNVNFILNVKKVYIVLLIPRKTMKTMTKEYAVHAKRVSAQKKETQTSILATAVKINALILDLLCVLIVTLLVTHALAI